MLGFGQSSSLLKNTEIQSLLHPSNSYLPYVYDKINTFGDCTDWDFAI